MVSGQRGFTLVELMVSLVVLEVGLLGWLATRVLVTRAVARGAHAAAAATFAAQRLERLRATACARRADSAEVRYLGPAPLDSLAWRFADLGDQRWSVVLRSTYLTERNRWRTDSVETEVSCAS